MYNTPVIMTSHMDTITTFNVLSFIIRIQKQASTHGFLTGGVIVVGKYNKHLDLLKHTYITVCYIPFTKSLYANTC